MEERFELINRRLALLEYQVRVLSDAVGAACPTFVSDPQHVPQMHLGGGATSEVPAAVLALARGGKRIAAIKLLRELTGAGLAEAKAVVESL